MSENVKRVQVTFTKEQWQLIEKLRGVFGVTDSEIVRNIVLAWLAEKSMISFFIKESIVNSSHRGQGIRRNEV